MELIDLFLKMLFVLGAIFIFYVVIIMTAIVFKLDAKSNEDEER